MDRRYGNAPRADRVAELHGQLEAGLERLVSGDDWRRMLETASRFHRYSANNALLIMCQRPDATRVAGYRTWQSLGRQVQRGEHGIAVLAPCRYKVDLTDPEGNKTGEHGWQVRGFKVEHVLRYLADRRRGSAGCPPGAGRWDRAGGDVGWSGSAGQGGGVHS
jgi:hypothetical protein